MRRERRENARKALQNKARRHKARLQHARLAARILNGLGWLSLVWAWFFPTPYSLVALLAALLPFAAVHGLGLFAGMLRFEPLSRRDGMAIFPAFLTSSSGLAFLALRFNVLDWRLFWLPFFLLTAALFAFTYKNAAEVRKRLKVLIPVLILCLGYGAGATIALNGVLAWAPPERYEAEVLAKRIAGRRDRTYYLRLAPWGPRTAPTEVKVPKSVFDRRSEGEPVAVTVNRGLFYIPWAEIQ